MKTLFGFACVFVLFLASCTERKEQFTFSTDIQEPQNYLSRNIASILSEKTRNKFLVVNGIGSSASLDSLKEGKIDFSIVDNYTIVSDEVASIMPLYPQILHVMHKRGVECSTIEELIKGKKIYAGVPGSGTYKFLKDLMKDYGIRNKEVTILSEIELFKADVIFSFTDLLSNDELRDLDEYRLFSFDSVEKLGRGSLAEGICTRYPYFSPYIVAKDVYGDYTEDPVLTLEIDAILVGRTNLDRELVYEVLKTLDQNKQKITTINPLFHDFSGTFDPNKLNIQMHQGARDYLERYEPTFLEKYAEVLSVIISIFVALASTLYSVSSWQKTRKKNKIDVYYNKLIAIRGKINSLTCSEEADILLEEVKQIQEETVELVVREKLMADESFSIFLNLSKMIADEIIATYQHYKSSEALF